MPDWIVQIPCGFGAGDEFVEEAAAYTKAVAKIANDLGMLLALSSPR